MNLLNGSVNLIPPVIGVVGWNKAEWKASGPGDLTSGLPFATQLYTDLELCIMEYALEGADVLRAQVNPDMPSWSPRGTSLYSDHQGNPCPHDWHWAFTLYYEDPGETIEGVPVMSDGFITEERWKRIDFDPLANPKYGREDMWSEVKSVFEVDQEKPDPRQIGLLMGALMGTILQGDPHNGVDGLMNSHLRFPDPDLSEVPPMSERAVQGIPIPLRPATKNAGIARWWWNNFLKEHHDLEKPEQRVLRRLETRVWATDAVGDAWALVSGADRIFVKGWS